MTPPAVVVAEDSLVIRAVLVEQLRSRGYRVIEAGDGEEALAVCRREQPDVVLLDVEMPHLDGHGVLARIKADPRLADIPVVFVTSRVTTEDVVDGLRLGAHDYLRKPFEPSELLAWVHAAVRIKALQDELRLRNAELELASRTDALTGLRNRRHLEEQLQRLAATGWWPARHRSPRPGREPSHLTAKMRQDTDDGKQPGDTGKRGSGWPTSR